MKRDFEDLLLQPTHPHRHGFETKHLFVSTSTGGEVSTSPMGVIKKTPRLYVSYPRHVMLANSYRPINHPSTTYRPRDLDSMHLKDPSSYTYQNWNIKSIHLYIPKSFPVHFADTNLLSNLLASHHRTNHATTVLRHSPFLPLSSFSASTR